MTTEEEKELMARIGQLAGPSSYVGFKRLEASRANPTAVQARSIVTRTNAPVPSQPVFLSTGVRVPWPVQATTRPATASLNTNVQSVHISQAARIAGRPTPGVAAFAPGGRPCSIATGLSC